MEKEEFLKIKVENILLEYFQNLPAQNRPRYTDWYFAPGGPWENLPMIMYLAEKLLNREKKL